MFHLTTNTQVSSLLSLKPNLFGCLAASDSVVLVERPFTNDVVPYIHPAIDPSKRSEVMNETMGDIIDSGRQDFATLDKEFQEKGGERRKLLKFLIFWLAVSRDQQILAKNENSSPLFLLSLSHVLHITWW